MSKSHKTKVGGYNCFPKVWESLRKFNFSFVFEKLFPPFRGHFQAILPSDWHFFFNYFSTRYPPWVWQASSKGFFIILVPNSPGLGAKKWFSKYKRYSFFPLSPCKFSQIFRPFFGSLLLIFWSNFVEQCCRWD